VVFLLTRLGVLDKIGNIDKKEEGRKQMESRRAGWGVILVGIMGVASWGYFDGYELNIGLQGRFGNPPEPVAPYLESYFDAAGYSDEINYGPSLLHEYEPYHEMLSGEWAAAIYYDGIDTGLIEPSEPDRGRKAMWLTKQFVFPDWWTNSLFHPTEPIICEAWNNPANPAASSSGRDTGRSVIVNDEVSITINYELVDLAGIDPNQYSENSPMTFLDPLTGLVRYLPSDRYCILQTYTIFNRSGRTLTNLEFYQFLHSHGADEYGACVNSTYCSAYYPDPLESYVPYNPVHCAPGSNTAGNFRYDITQWNTYPHARMDPSGRADHVDFVGFSSAVEPTWVDTDVYRGGHLVNETYKPAAGTHMNIENRRLNGKTAVYLDEVGGAMGWALGTLGPNETAKITVAFMYVRFYEEPAPVTLSKSDDVEPGDCVSPGEELTYTITWTNQSGETLRDVTLTDVLPRAVTVPQGSWTFDPNQGPFFTLDPSFHAVSYSYTWYLGDIGPYESGFRTLTVTVNESAEPGMTLHNLAVFRTGDMRVAYAALDTPVCCWDATEPNVIYVDASAGGLKNGTNWADAYTDLQDALNRAKESACGQTVEIRVAQGTYASGLQESDTFAIPDGVKVCGGFRGGLVEPDRRNPRRHETILSGYHRPDPVRPPMRNKAV